MKKRITIRLSDKLDKWLEEKAKIKDIKKSTFVRHCLEFIKNNYEKISKTNIKYFLER